MNYNDIKNLNISKRGKKELLNALNKGGGSGAGVTIVDSIDKLDENAPVGSLAVVAKEGNSTKAKFSELYQLDMNTDMEVDRVNMTITIKNQEKFDLISDVDIILPKDNKLISGKTSTLLIGPFEIFNDLMMGNGGMSSLSGAIVIGPRSENDILVGIEGAVIYNGETHDFVLIQNDGEKYILNEEGIREFKNHILNIDVLTYYICEMNSIMGNTELPIYLDNFITFYKGERSDSKIFIKKDKWTEPNDSVFAKLNSDLIELKDKISKFKTQEVIHLTSNGNYRTINPNNYYVFDEYAVNGCYILLDDPEPESNTYKEYMIEIKSKVNKSVIFKNSEGEDLTINWINGASAVIDIPAGFTCLVSIVNGLGINTFFETLQS